MTRDVVISQVPDLLWVPAYTKPRCEKVVRDYCQRHDIPAYLPLIRRAERYQRRTVETYLPMFRSYVFVQVGAGTVPLLLQSHRVVHCLEVTPTQEETLVRELQDIRRLERLQTEAELVVLPELQPGQPIVVRNGPLKGMTGIVTRRRNRTRVTVNVELLGQAVSAELDIGEIAIDTD
ncbi:MAG: hypothetical protein JXR77_10015 [Lentisphaeria bacterium]|nr:hypothetical protein [Lentisphaeria bacterium]